MTPEMRAHYEPSPPWVGGGRLWLYRLADGRVHYLTPRGATVSAPAEVLAPTETEDGWPVWWQLPRGAWEAICALAAPHADAGEVKALREALNLERVRVDATLARLSERSRS